MKFKNIYIENNANEFIITKMINIDQILKKYLNKFEFLLNNKALKIEPSISKSFPQTNLRKILF